MLQRLPITFVQVKANTSEDLFHEIRQFVDSLYPAKDITKQIYNTENSKASDPYSLVLNLADKINFKRSDKYAPLSNLTIYYRKGIDFCENQFS